MVQFTVTGLLQSDYVSVSRIILLHSFSVINSIQQINRHPMIKVKKWHFHRSSNSVQGLQNSKQKNPIDGSTYIPIPVQFRGDPATIFYSAHLLLSKHTNTSLTSKQSQSNFQASMRLRNCTLP